MALLLTAVLCAVVAMWFAVYNARVYSRWRLRAPLFLAGSLLLGALSALLLAVTALGTTGPWPFVVALGLGEKAFWISCLYRVWREAAELAALKSATTLGNVARLSPPDGVHLDRTPRAISLEDAVAMAVLPLVPFAILAPVLWAGRPQAPLGVYLSMAWVGLDFMIGVAASLLWRRSEPPASIP